jgi:site-specific recombinase XerD
MKIIKEIDQYFDSVKSRYKKNTIIMFERHLKSIKEALIYSNVKTLKKLEVSDCYLMCDYYKKYTTLKNSTINRRIQILKRIIDFYDYKSTFKSFKPLRDDTTPYRRFYQEELSSIIDYLQSLNDNINSCCIKAITYLFLDSGMRFTEMLNVRIKDISFQPKRIYLGITKNGKPRYAPFGNFSEELLKQYIFMNPDREYLCWNFFHDRMFTKTAIRNIYRRMASKLNIDTIHPHRFRKTMASMLLENGMNINDLQILLDHTKIETTMLYAQFNEQRALQQYDIFAKWHY